MREWIELDSEFVDLVTSGGTHWRIIVGGSIVDEWRMMPFDDFNS